PRLLHHRPPRHRPRHRHLAAALSTVPKTASHHPFPSCGIVFSSPATGSDSVMLARIEPDSTYLQGATAPLSGARLIFAGSTESKMPTVKLTGLALDLGDYLGLNQQVMEDSLCNWQKSPAKFIPFRG